MLSCIIIDDEEGAIKVLENYIGKLDSIQLAATFTNAVDAFHYLKDNNTDLVLLDINLPEVDGFGLLDILEQRPMVIFTTAYSNYALKGFEYNAIDYLHKPIRFERFLLAIEKAIKWHSVNETDKEITAINLKVDGTMLQVNVSDIHYVESLGNYIKVHTKRKDYVVHMTMNEMEQTLPSDNFVRIHKSFIANASEITGISDNQLALSNESLPIGKTYKKYLREFLKKMSPDE